MTKVIALTGGIASGKSTVGKLLKDKNFDVIDLDKTVHDLENENKDVINKIVKLFGVKTTNNGKINRSQLAEIVFNDKNALKRLVRILNPFLIKEINSHTDEDVIFIEAPTLFENGLQVYVDKIIMIACDPVIQMQRLIKRNTNSIRKANLLMKSQWPQSVKKELSDVVIDSTNGIDELKKQVLCLLDDLR